MVQNDIYQSKMNFLSANSRFAVQNDGTYLLRITRETCLLSEVGAAVLIEDCVMYTLGTQLLCIGIVGQTEMQ
jgi:hypothetical protein